MRTPLGLLTLLVFLNSACSMITDYSPSMPVGELLVETHDELKILFLSYAPGSLGYPDRFTDVPPGPHRFYMEGPNIPDQVLFMEGVRTPSWVLWEIKWLRDQIENHSKFRKVIVTEIPPVMGVRVNVYQTPVQFSTPWCTVSMWTLGVIPCYSEGLAYETRFDVIVDNTLKQSYRYPIYRKAVQGIGLAAFAWISLFNTSYGEAFSANAYQFVTDAKRDGFL